MARKSQVDVAIERLELRKKALRARVDDECAAIDTAIDALKGPIVRRVRKPRAVAMAAESKAG